MSEDHLCPSYAVAVGYFAVASAVVFSNFGSAWGTWRAGVTILHSGIRHPEGVMKNIIPIVMAGVIGIYGLIVAVILGQSIDTPDNNRYNTYSTYTAMAHLAAGLCCGLSGLAAGGTIGIIGDYGIRSIGYRITKVSLFESTSPNALDGPTRPSNNTQETSGLLAAEDFDFEADDQNKLFVSMLIMLIFSEALALYGLIVALIVSQHMYTCEGETMSNNILNLSTVHLDTQ